MTLKEKYTIRNKKRMKQFIFLYSILVIFFVVYTSLAKYENASEVHTKITLANWKFSINDKKITSTDNELIDSIILIPTTGIVEENPTKIKSGQTGYFDIKIDPTDTEVSFWYQVTLDMANSKLPKGLTISSYSLDGGKTTKTLPSNKIVSNNVSLGNKDIFTEDDIQTIRYYWDWASGDNENIAYTIVANVQIKQIL